MKKLLAMLTICALLAICALADEAVEVWDEPAVDEVEEFELGEENTPWEDDGEEIDPPLEEEEFDLPLEEESALADEAAMVEIPAGGVDIDTAFPDDNFRAYVSENFDTDHDGKLSEEECKAVTKIEVSAMEISDLTGIAWFSELKVLDCTDNNLEALNVSANAELIELYCGFNALTALDVSANAKLGTLHCYDNELTAIDVTHNPNLSNLNVNSNQLTRLDTSQNPRLFGLDCRYNQLTSLNLEANTVLCDLYCESNLLTALNVSQCEALSTLDCRYNQITSLDVTNCTGLWDLYCQENQLTTLNIGANAELRSLECENNQIASLNLSQCGKLEYLSCNGNALVKLDVSACPLLEHLYCGNNNLSVLNVGHNPKLTCLMCYDNQISVLDTSQCPDLDFLHCSENRLTALNTSGNPKLTDLLCYENGIKALDLSGNPKLIDVSCNDNELSALDLSKNTSLETLNCEGNNIEIIDISTCATLAQVVKEDNGANLNPFPFTRTRLQADGTRKDEESTCICLGDLWFPPLEFDASAALIIDGKAIYTPPAASVALSKTELSLTAGGSATLTATIAPANALNSTVVWTSSDASVATVKNGVVTALKPGSATITAAASDNASVKTACAVKVVPPLPASVTLSKTELSLTTGDSATLTATVAPANASSSAVVWTSSDASVATVKDGVVTAVKPGSATITAAATDNPSAKAACAVKVVPPVKPVPKTGSNGTLSVNLGDQVQLSGDFATSRGWKITRYQSGKSSVATVTQDGLVTAMKEGKVKITITAANKKKATVTINVVDPTKPTGVKITQGKACTLKFGETLRLEATLAPATAQSALTWKSSKPKVASVSPDGVVTPKKEGTTKITVTTRNKKKATVTVKVVDPYKPTGVKITQDKTVTLNLGQSLSLGATLSPAGARSALTWKSSKPKVASVSPDGVVTPKKEGTAKITVTTYNKKKATVTVKVVDPTKPTGVKITQGKAVTLKAGQTLPLEATLSPVTAQSALTWKSSKPKVASVSPDGVVTANKKGTAKITVTARNKKKATLTIKVVD